VATDAIGMGLNLDIDHVVFTSLASSTASGRGRSPRRGGPDRGARRATRERRPVRRDRGARRDGPEARGGVESHRFAPLTHLQWRTDELDFFSPLGLLGSLERQPPHPFLLRMRHAEDQRTLAALVRDEEAMALARDATPCACCGRCARSRTSRAC